MLKKSENSWKESFVFFRASPYLSGLRLEVPAMLFKIAVKERERRIGGLMKYLRFGLKRDSENICNKRVCRGPPLSRDPAEAGAKLQQI